MITEDQSAVVAFLSDPSTHDGAPVERIETHASIVFLAGDRALKLKRAVRYDYLDFSTTERRRLMCEAEVRVNRRTAPQLYHGVIAVTREADGTLALGGTGTPVDWVVEMSRFDQEALFDRQAAQRQLDLALMRPLGVAIARFHAAAERRRDQGGAAGLAWVVDGNDAGLAEEGRDIFDAAERRRVMAATRESLEQHHDLLESRRLDGFVRECHGDLHLRNIVVIDGQPTLFDAIEFNDAIACIDVLYDLAFLLMDLEHRELTAHANAVLNGYLGVGHDLDGLALLPLFLSCRAAVRAKTGATAARLASDPAQRADQQDAARGYLAMAGRLIAPPRACLVAVGGLSGTGKSTIARALAPVLGPVPGAVIFRSDEIRKELFGVDPLERLGPEAYTADVTERVYAEALARAQRVVRAGHAAVVDAVFGRPEQRVSIERAAREAGVPFAGIWLDAPAAVLEARIGARRGDVSDADVSVVRQQLARDPGPVTWARVDASGQPTDVVREARNRLASTLGDAVR